MITIKGRILKTHYYANSIPSISAQIYAMTAIPKSPPWYVTVNQPTRWIDLESDFRLGYSKRLQKYLRNDVMEEFTIHRPLIIPDILEMFNSTIEAKNLNSYPSSIVRIQDNYYYSEIHHRKLGRLAAHLCIGDKDNKIAMGYINASNFRKFEDKHSARIASIANKALFDNDLHYLQSLGYQTYDMVGITEPMNQMKKEFGGKILPTYTHIPSIIYGLDYLRKRF
ncbi:hypothetical protein [Membranihabitans marinus]|uniref:hypothetical protein n=1 Tax=Membranihabitans marinus TaxID=1227546 RepID=UPI001F1B80C2|nr:hypothetical protein [Membranihabitans marinus]